ncbi:coiled-coil domain-containing protein 81-like [Tyto alba]|uniref:coiled-coil domain-containing protein 81-like n=1 Tax=Tyto alba TaxID=56313 RepID=UPI001C66A3F7|nr:coiled-coil domain-containing protein 81-like [Tyto alba]
MNFTMAVANKKQPASARRSKIEFWDGMKDTFMMPSIPVTERIRIWDVVSSYIQEHLLLHKGVRIPTLGSFDVVPTHIQVGNKKVTVQSPVFHLARNLAVHNLMEYKAYLPGNKELKPLKYAEVAAAASVSRRKVEICIQGTMSLLSQCMGKGENVALVLKGMGVLLIEDRRVQMNFYSDFLEKITARTIQEVAALKVFQMLSPTVPIASLTFTGRVIIFPE